jgi:hypothetical protein
MMRMLYRGGIQVIAENKTSFEDVRTVQRNIPLELFCDNMAIKVLDPIQFRPPMGPHYKFILMDRDPRELIRSHAKWETGNRDYPSKTKPRSVKKRLYDTKLLLDRYPHSSVLVVRFEDILENPKWEGYRVSKFLDMDLDIAKMIGCVHKRSPECLPEMAEFDFEEEE